MAVDPIYTTDQWRHIVGTTRMNVPMYALAPNEVLDRYDETFKRKFVWGDDYDAFNCGKRKRRL